MPIEPNRSTEPSTTGTEATEPSTSLAGADPLHRLPLGPLREPPPSGRRAIDEPTSPQAE
eukprot:14100161-Alexandrium_andersonii.AAC.1